MVVTAAKWSVDERGTWLSLLAKSPQEARKAVDDITDGTDYAVDIKRHRERRSKDANAYFHLLVNKIARAVSLGDTEVKNKLVSEYGTLERDDDGKPIGIKVPASANMTKCGLYLREYKRCMENGREYVCYLIYKPTHDLDSKEMSALIDGTVQEAKDLGIETMTPEELAMIKEAWGNA